MNETFVLLFLRRSEARFARTSPSGYQLEIFAMLPRELGASTARWHVAAHKWGFPLFYNGQSSALFRSVILSGADREAVAESKFFERRRSDEKPRSAATKGYTK